jgi:3-hydroxyacyl-[acyl-carrier-protein] dehydratase
MKLQSLLLAASLATTCAFTAPNGVINGATRATSTSLSADTVEAPASTDMMGAAKLSALTKEVKTIFTSEDIDKVLPHRYPFALVDKVVEYEAGKRAVGIKCVTKNEEFFNGHFPSRPVMPGVLQVEALAQLAGVVCLQMEGAEPGAVFFFAGVDGVKWKKPVVPGDTLIMEVTIEKWNKVRPLTFFSCLCRRPCTTAFSII